MFSPSSIEVSYYDTNRYYLPQDILYPPYVYNYSLSFCFKDNIDTSNVVNIAIK